MTADPEPRPLYRAYIDETGDRGIHPRSSPYFTMAAVVVKDTDDRRLRELVEQICQLGPGARVKWDKMKHHQRRYATELLATVNLRIIYVIVPKASLPTTSGMAADHKKFYNWTARLLVERISWLVNARHGVCKLTFEKVRGFPTYEVTDYLALLRRRANDPHQRINWAAISPVVVVDSPANFRNLCAADTAAGAIDSAMRPDPLTGLVEPAYLFNLAPRIMRSNGRALRNGLKVLAQNDDVLTTLPWWPGPFA